ncbi:hypothetical protein [Clostridium drakei]|uniref:Uncharacterized protein n=1 Tax=Clostridium drakei TaxID=332101 RepID=A0A2U8DLG5_9CLOT|nr:hypothetical protein B9W14_03120 [Clostridium drakei]
MDEEDNRYIELSIPNREVKYIFRTKILKWFEEKIKTKDLSVLYAAIINKDSETFQEELNKLYISSELEMYSLFLCKI